MFLLLRNVYDIFGLFLLQAAMCYVHVAALVAEYLWRKGESGYKNHSRFLPFTRN